MNVRAPRLTSPHAADSRNVSRLVCCAVAVLSVAAGIVHVSAAADHTNLPVMMAGFLVVATLQVALGGLLVWRRPSRLLLLAAVALMISSVGLWVVSRTAGLPFLPGGHMEPIGFKDAITVLFEIASLPGLMLLMSRDLDTVTLPSPRLGAQALAGLAAGTFVLFTPALVLTGGGHHSADQRAAMEGHHGDQASAAHGDGESGHDEAGHSGSGGSADHKDGGHGDGSGDGGSTTGDSADGHDGHDASGGERASAGSSGGGGGGASGGHGSHGGSGPGARRDEGHRGGDHSGRGESRGGARGESGDRGGHGHDDDGAGQAPGGGQQPGNGHGDSHPPAGAAEGGDHGGQPGEDDDYPGPDGNLTWGPHSLDFEPAREAKDGKAGAGNAFVYRGPPDASQGTVGHHGGGSCNPTPAQRTAADRLFRRTHSVLKPYRNNPAKAYADGFTYAFPVTDRITHMVSPRRVYDPTILDPGEIESFLYVQTERGLWPVGGMYIMPDPDMKGPQVGGCRTRWHRHAGAVGLAVSAGTMMRTPEMLHVYTYPGLDPYGHYDGRAMSSLWRPGSLLPNVCRESGDSSDACLP